MSFHPTLQYFPVRKVKFKRYISILIFYSFKVLKNTNYSFFFTSSTSNLLKHISIKEKFLCSTLYIHVDVQVWISTVWQLKVLKVTKKDTSSCVTKIPQKQTCVNIKSSSSSSHCSSSSSVLLLFAFGDLMFASCMLTFLDCRGLQCFKTQNYQKSWTSLFLFRIQTKYKKSNIINWSWQ